MSPEAEPAAEVDLRLDAAANLLAAAEVGFIERDLAATGAIGLIEAARRHLRALPA